MKQMILSLSCLFSFIYSGFGQADSAAVAMKVDSLRKASIALVSKRDFEQAFKINAQALQMAIGHFSEDAPLTADCFLTQGLIFDMSNRLEEAIQNYRRSKEIREKIQATHHPAYCAALINMAILYKETGQVEIAEQLYREARQIFEKLPNYRSHPFYANCIGNLGNLYMETGRYEAAEPLILEAKSLREKSSGKQHSHYASSLNSLGMLNKEMGNYEQAERYFTEARIIREKTSGKLSLDYGQSLQTLGAFYISIGQFEAAEALFQEALSLWKTLGNEHGRQALALGNLGIVHLNMNRFKTGEQFLVEARELWEKYSGKEDVSYFMNLNTLGVLYFKTGRYEQAEKLYLELKTASERISGKPHPYYALALNNLATLCTTTGRYEDAASLHREAIDILLKTVGKETADYDVSLLNLAVSYELLDRPDAAEPLWIESAKIKQTRLIKAVAFLSELELAGYIRTFNEGNDQLLTFAEAHQNRTDKRPAIAFDNALFYKSFLLHAGSRIKHLADSGPEASEQVNLLKSCHRRLAQQYALPIAERDSVLISMLETQVNTLEKDLARTVAGFGEALRQVSWQEVQAALKSGEAAIEFVHFNYYNPKPADSVLYAALLLKPGMENPAFIPLFEEKQLDALLIPLAGPGSNGPNELYGGKTGQSLYRLLWTPLESHLKGVKTVYFSPAGLLHRLNLGAIPTGKSKETIGKRHALLALGSTRQLVVTPATPAANTAAVVFGGIQYDMDSTAVAAGTPDGLAGHRGLSFSQTDSTLRSGSWKYLKYSEREADNIQAQLQKAGFQASVHKGYAATEETFKHLGKDHPSPRILHVSTHGFFFPDPAGVRNTNYGIRSEAEIAFKISDHPMIRSGLIFAGANHAWAQGRPLGNREDGILTAYEISQMDMRHTELVVLSACETGLGDIRGNEGVYGLQRAFKIAGAKNLIMSLWQVPDFQTQELMTVFYQKWLEEKMTVRQALTAAQEEMQRRRYEPFYWAGFVLVE